MFSLQNRADKTLRINWPLNYTLQYVLHVITLTGRCGVFLSFVCFSCFRFKHSLFFDRRQVRSVLGLERRQTCALDPRFNSKSNCTQRNRVTTIGLHKKEIFRNVSKQQRRRSLSKRGGGGVIKGSFIHGFPCSKTPIRAKQLFMAATTQI